MNKECKFLECALKTQNFNDINIWINKNCECFYCNIVNEKFMDVKKKYKNTKLYEETAIMKVKTNNKMNNNINRQIINKKIKTYIFNKNNNNIYYLNSIFDLLI